jgi:hypothetical protein
MEPNDAARAKTAHPRRTARGDNEPIGSTASWALASMKTAKRQPWTVTTSTEMDATMPERTSLSFADDITWNLMDAIRGGMRKGDSERGDDDAPLQPIWRCELEKCGWWKRRTLLRELIPLTPTCKYCCTKCAPGQCTSLHNEKAWRHPKVRLWEAYRDLDDSG